MELTVDQMLQQGLSAHNAGNSKEAERLYRAILQVQPKHPDANHNLGLIAVSMNQSGVALPLFKSAIKVNPNIEQFWLSYIEALITERQFEETKRALKKAKKKGVPEDKLKALTQKLVLTKAGKAPSQAELQKLINHYQNEQYDDAEKLAILLTQQFPRDQFSWKMLGVLFGQTGRKAEALVANQKAVELSPQDAVAHRNLGGVLKELGRLEEAINSFKSAKLLDPNLDFGAGFAAAYLKNKDPKNALRLLEDLVKKNPQDARATAYKTIALRGLGEFDQIEELIAFPSLVKTINTQILTDENIAKFNKELRSALVKDPRRRAETRLEGLAIRGGTRIGDLFNTTNPSYTKFETLLRKAIDYYIDDLPDNSSHPFLMMKAKCNNIDSCWVNFLEPGDYQSNHIHNQGWMSGVYYLDEPEIELNKEHAGWIEFNRAGYNLPHFAGEKGIELIKPKAGMFIFFPSYIWHGTIPYTHAYSRISISFDIKLS